MNKKLLALAIAAALAPAAAMADSGNVKISGILHMSVDSLDDGQDRNLNVSSNSSRIIFSGDEDLGNGLKAVWQLTTFVGMGDTSVGGLNSWTNGNSYLGLNGGFGTALVGRHDTPMKLAGRKTDLFGDQIGDSRNMISAGGIGDLRVNNVIAYVSPTISGMHGAIAYVTNADNAGAAANNATTAVSLLGMYESGPAMVGIAYEKHNVDGTSADPHQWRVVGGYSFGDVKLVGSYQKADDLNVVDSNDRKVWGLGAAYKMGATTIKGQYYRAGDLNGAADTGANMFALGADYSLSKRTTTYVAYAKTNQDDNTINGTAFGSGHGDNPNLGAAGAGKDPSGFSIGLKHSF